MFPTLNQEPAVADDKKLPPLDPDDATELIDREELLKRAREAEKHEGEDEEG